MTKSEYIDNKKKIENQINDLRKKLKSLESEYIESNRLFKNGEKVKVINTITGKDKFAFVYAYEIMFNAKLKPKLKRCKKDGTMSKVDYDLWSSETVSPIKKPYKSIFNDCRDIVSEDYDKFDDINDILLRD